MQPKITDLGVQFISVHKDSQRPLIRVHSNLTPNAGQYSENAGCYLFSRYDAKARRAVRITAVVMGRLSEIEVNLKTTHVPLTVDAIGRITVER